MFFWKRGFCDVWPYISLQAGRYAARIDLLSGGRMEGRGICDVCFRSGKVIVTSMDVNLSELHRPSIELLFELSERQDDVEVRFFAPIGRVLKSLVSRYDSQSISNRRYSEATAFQVVVVYWI